MFKHHLPQTVLSPRDCVSNVQIIYDGGALPGEYAVARLDWNGQPTLGIRWNIAERETGNPDKVSGKITCMGEPNSRGYPTWFILPDAFLQNIMTGGDVAVAIREYLEEE
jgi:hypothetical protein